MIKQFKRFYGVNVNKQAIPVIRFFRHHFWCWLWNYGHWGGKKVSARKRGWKLSKIAFKNRLQSLILSRHVWWQVSSLIHSTMMGCGRTFKNKCAQSVVNYIERNKRHLWNNLINHISIVHYWQIEFFLRNITVWFSFSFYY